MSANTYSTISPRTTVRAMAPLLARATPAEMLQKLGQVYNIGAKKSDTASFRRYNALAALTAPATEGVTPPPTAILPTTVMAQLDQWISHVQFTDRIMDTHEDPILQEFGQIVMDQQVETRELQAWGGIKGGTSVIYNNGVQRTDVNTAITRNKIDSAVRFLRSQRAKYIKKILSGSPDYLTSPVDQAYVAVCSSDLDRDIEQLAGFVPRHKYGNTADVVSEFELGSVGKVRFVTHAVFGPMPNAGAANSASFICTAGGTIDVYPICIFGEDAFGHTALRGINAASLMIVNAGSPSDSDPAGQRGHITAKSYYKFVRLNELWMTRIECAATNL